MKVNWFSPLPPTRSSIAHDTATVLPALAQRAELVLWTHERTTARSLEKYAEVRHYEMDAIPWQAINAADVTVYHLGNEPRYHGPIWQVERRHPGLVVLHDLNLQELFAGCVATSCSSPGEYIRLMQEHHGESGRVLAKEVLTGARSAAAAAEQAPLTAAAVVNALGVVVHTDAGRERLARTTGQPVHYVPLFVPPLPAPPPESRGRQQRRHDRYQIIIFGFLGANRRLDSIFKALQQFPQRDQFHLDIYGTVAAEARLKKMVRELDLKSLVTFHGFVEDAELDLALRRSDLALNLRDPTMGEVSASQLRIWQHGLPSLVTDVGWYATLPRDTVATVRRAAEQEDILFHLERFLADPAPYRQLGQNGRAYVNQHHTVDAYVDGLLVAAEAAVASRARAVVRQISFRAGHAMRPWFTDEAAGILLPRVAGTISRLFDDEPSSPRGEVAAGR